MAIDDSDREIAIKKLQNRLADMMSEFQGELVDRDLVQRIHERVRTEVFKLTGRGLIPQWEFEIEHMDCDVCDGIGCGQCYGTGKVLPCDGILRAHFTLIWPDVLVLEMEDNDGD